MDEEKTKDLILAWCRKQKKPTGMRQFGVYSIVCLLGTFKNVYKNTEHGLPTDYNTFNPEIVLAHGRSWTEVATVLGL